MWKKGSCKNRLIFRWINFVLLLSEGFYLENYAFSMRIFIYIRDQRPRKLLLIKISAKSIDKKIWILERITTYLLIQMDLAEILERGVFGVAEHEYGKKI